jgi:hypothetical protein
MQHRFRWIRSTPSIPPSTFVAHACVNR